MEAVVVCGGNINDYSKSRRYFKDNILVICADGGARHLRNLEIIPDILVGDFDSISSEDYYFYTDKKVEIVRYPVEKDMTDTQLAIEIAVQKGCKSVTLLGATGTRLDHTMANVFLLKKLLDSGIRGVLADEHNEMELIKDRINLVKENTEKVSLIPVFGRVTGVSTKGLYYPLDKATLEPGTTWGISNEFTETQAAITIEEGILLVIKARD